MILINKKTYRNISIGFIFASLAAVGLFYLSKSKSFQFWGDIYPRVNTEQKVIAITFDDGPSAQIDTVLSILEKHEVKATFFLAGHSMTYFPEETKRIVISGHELGNHGYTHRRLWFRSYKTIKDEIEKTDSLIRKAGYHKTIHVRSPHAMKLLVLPYYLNQMSRKMVTWDVEPESVNRIASNPERLADYVVENAQNGSIILLHVMYDWNKNSIAALEEIIEGMKKKGFVFKTVSELLEYEDTAL